MRRYDGGLDADIVVVGAGIIGLSIARELTRSGWNCIVLDRQEAGKESSWAGAGMLMPHGESFPDPVWKSRAMEALAAYPDFVAALQRESGLSIDFRICGSVSIENGRRVEFPDEAQVDPRDIVAALRANLDVREHAPVSSIEENGSSVRVRDLQARAAVIAAGAWSGQIPGMPATFPVRGHLLGYRLEAGTLPAILRSGHTYIVQRANGYTIVGSTEENVGFDRALDQQALAALRRRGEDLWPPLRGLQPADAWCGFRPATPSGLPEVGRLGDRRIWTAFGHFRNGILLADVTAKLIARDVTSSLKKD